MSEKRADAQHVLDAIGEIDEQLIAEAAAFREADAPGVLAVPEEKASKPKKVKFGRIVAIGMPLLAAAIVGLVVLMNGGLSNLSHNAAGDSAPVASEKSKDSAKSQKKKTKEDTNTATMEAAAPAAAEEEGAMASAAEDTEAGGGSLSEEILTQAEVAMEDASDTDNWYVEEDAAAEPEEEPSMVADSSSKAAKEESFDGAEVATPVSIMPEAQVLRIIGDGTKLNIAPGAQSWIHLTAEGKPVATTVDAPAADDPETPMPVIPLSDGYAVKEANAAAFVFYFPLTEDTITVRAWEPGTEQGEKVWVFAGEVAPETDGYADQEGTAFILHSGCRYEITASWGEDALQRWGGFGEASYTIEIE